MKKRFAKGLVLIAAVSTVMFPVDGGNLDPPGPPNPTMLTVQDLGLMSQDIINRTDQIEQLLFNHAIPEDPGDLCDFVNCAPGTCNQVSILTAGGGDFYKGCSEAAAKRKSHAAMLGVCGTALPCSGTCPGGGTCTSYVSSLSYTMICSPSTVAGCAANDDPHTCVAIAKSGGDIRCACACAL